MTNGLTSGSAKWESEHKSLAYFIKRTIITDNLFGVDLMEEATEIARLRLFLAWWLRPKPWMNWNRCRISTSTSWPAIR